MSSSPSFDLPPLRAAAVGGRQRAAQLADGVVEVHLRRAFADPQRLADVPERQVLVDAQLQRHALLGRQLVHRRAQRRRLLRRLEPIERADGDVLVAGADFELAVVGDEARVIADVVQRQVRADAQEPGSKHARRRAARRACPSRARTIAGPDRPPRRCRARSAGRARTAPADGGAPADRAPRDRRPARA